MRKPLIFILIASITLSLLGLIGIQIYWIRNAVSVKEVNFDRGASEAIGRAIYKFNKIELTRKMLAQREKGQQMSDLFHTIDSLNQLYYKQLIGHQPPEGLLNDTTYYSLLQEVELSLRHQGGNNPNIQFFDTNFVETADSGLENTRGYARGPDDRIQEDPFSFFFERSKIINDLFEDIFSNRRPFTVSSEESTKTLDSLLNSEFQSHGIKTAYEFGIYNSAYNEITNEKTGQFTPDLLQSQYVYSLYPNDVFANPEYLLVYFPDQKRYILSQMNAMLATSTLFILIIISSFAFTIITIIRQKKLSRMKTDFINNMTHELKTPISTISLACQALSDKDVQKSENLYQSYINMINEENKRLGSMTEKVLQTAVIEKGRMRLNTAGLDIHEIIQDAIHKIGLQVEARNGKISTKLHAQYSYIKADKVHLTNVFFNLLDNANKYSPINPQIEVLTENNNNGVLIHVKDNGVGINRVNQKKIFDNLYRVSTGNIHDVKGFGLGLGYVKAIAEQHGGWITVSSEPKKGSIFTVFIPFGFTSNEIQNFTS